MALFVGGTLASALVVVILLASHRAGTAFEIGICSLAIFAMIAIGNILGGRTTANSPPAGVYRGGAVLMTPVDDEPLPVSQSDSEADL